MSYAPVRSVAANRGAPPLTYTADFWFFSAPTSKWCSGARRRACQSESSGCSLVGLTTSKSISSSAIPRPKRSGAGIANPQGTPSRRFRQRNAFAICTRFTALCSGCRCRPEPPGPFIMNRCKGDRLMANAGRAGWSRPRGNTHRHTGSSGSSPRQCLRYSLKGSGRCLSEPLSGFRGGSDQRQVDTLVNSYP